MNLATDSCELGLHLKENYVTSYYLVPEVFQLVSINSLLLPEDHVAGILTMDQAVQRPPSTVLSVPVANEPVQNPNLKRPKSFINSEKVSKKRSGLLSKPSVSSREKQLLFRAGFCFADSN